ncbi:DNA repair protein RecO [Candidatus Woesebacteria bacterium]|nr:DNA repair protein RecO [Candidatus Woesebacteria bacterium]
MRVRSYTSEAIVIKRKNYGEADRIVTLYTSNFGKLSVLAKGVRKPKSRKRGGLEVFSHIKFSASRSKFLDIITEVEIMNLYPKVRSDIKRAALGYYLIETLDKLTQEEEKNFVLFKTIEDYLSRLEEEQLLRRLKEEYIFKLLTELGFWPAEEMIYDHDKVLEEIIEREIGSRRVGKKLFT